MLVMNNLYFSIWLKPMFKCLDKIIDCKKSKIINYNEIQKGNIVSLKFKGPGKDIYERTYIATSNWDKNLHSGSFINLNGGQVVLSEKVFKNLNVCVIGSFEVST